MATLNSSVMNCNYSTKRLFDSIRGGEDADVIQTLLQEHDDMDARDSDGYTPLLLACLHGRKEIVELLIQSGANVGLKCNDGLTVLHYASKFGWRTIIQTLVKKVPDLDARDIRGETAMHHASRSGWLQVVKYLVEQGADVDMKNVEGVIPVLCAASYERLDVVDLLLNSMANIDGYEGKLLFYASKYGWTNLVRSLVKRVPDLNKCYVGGRTALHSASSCGHLEIVKCLVKEGTDINCRDSLDNIALHNATAGRHLEIVKWLVEKGIDINARDKMGWSALHEAAIREYEEILRWLVERGIDMNIKNTLGWTALHIAVMRGRLDIVKCLVEKGADINLKDFSGYSPVLRAAQLSWKDVADLLIHSGANIDVLDKDKCSLLYYASRNGWIDIVQAIVKRNCDLDARSIYGEKTALGVACLCLNWDIVQYLLQAGASWDILDEKGYSPLNYFTNQNETEFKYIKLFIENGAYLKPVDYEGIVKSSSLKVLQNAKLCCRTIVNKFNNHDLPQLYKLPASGNLPRIEEMKIAIDSEVARAIERAVEFEIQTKGHCNVLEVRPMVLSVFSVRTVLEYCERRKLEELRNRSKRPNTFDTSNKCKHSSNVMIFVASQYIIVRYLPKIEVH